MIKKILCIFTCFAVMLSMILLPKNVHAIDSTGNLVSFDILEFNNGEIYTETDYEFTYEINDNLSYDDYWFYLYFVNDKGEVVRFYVDSNHNTMNIDEINKWKYEEYTFMYLEFVYAQGWDGYTEYYSKYTIDEIYNMYSDDPEGFVYFSDEAETISFDNDLSFRLLDSDIDESAPTLENLIITQNNNSLSYSFESNDDKSGVQEVVLEFSGESTGEWIEFCLEAQGNGETVGTIDLSNCYQNYPYDLYKLTSVRVRDKAGNESSSSSFNGSFTLSDELKPRKANVENYTYNISTEYVDNKVYLRKDTGYGRRSFGVEFINENGDVFYDDGVGDVRDAGIVDLSVASNNTYTFEFEYTINPSVDPVILSAEVDICVVEVIGTIKILDYYVEKCYTFEKYWDKVSEYDFEPKEFEVELFTGETTTTLAETGSWWQAPWFGDVPYMTEGVGYYYNPQYQLEIEENEYCAFNHETRIYLQDDDGNLLDFNGNIVVNYEDRATILHEADSEDVSITTLEGTLPTYSVASVEETDVSDVFDSTSQAYDITINAEDEQNVQPVGDVTVSIDLPESLKDKEVEVYYVDDGNTELVESTSDGETVTFETDHFSTYAIVEKKVDNTTNPDNGEEQDPDDNDTAVPNDPTDDTDNEDDTVNNNNQATKPEDSKEDKVEESDKPTETPDTGDHSNIEFYVLSFFVAALSLSYYAVKNRKQTNN